MWKSNHWRVPGIRRVIDKTVTSLLRSLSMWLRGPFANVNKHFSTMELLDSGKQKIKTSGVFCITEWTVSRAPTAAPEPVSWLGCRTHDRRLSYCLISSSARQRWDELAPQSKDDTVYQFHLYVLVDVCRPGNLATTQPAAAFLWAPLPTDHTTLQRISKNVF